MRVVGACRPCPSALPLSPRPLSRVLQSSTSQGGALGLIAIQPDWVCSGTGVGGWIDRPARAGRGQNEWDGRDRTGGRQRTGRVRSGAKAQDCGWVQSGYRSGGKRPGGKDMKRAELGPREGRSRPSCVGGFVLQLRGAVPALAEGVGLEGTVVQSGAAQASCCLAAVAGGLRNAPAKAGWWRGCRGGLVVERSREWRFRRAPDWMAE